MLILRLAASSSMRLLDIEWDLVFSRQPIIADKVGRKIASDLVTIIDDPIRVGYGHFICDHKGTRAKPHIIIKDGILAGFLHFLESAAKLGAGPEGALEPNCTITRPLRACRTHTLQPET